MSRVRDIVIALAGNRMRHPARGISSPSRSPSARRMADPERTLSFGVLEYAVDGHVSASSKIALPWLGFACARTTRAIFHDTAPCPNTIKE